MKTTLFGVTYSFADVKTVLAKANEDKSGDDMAEISASNVSERVAAKYVLSDLTLERIFENPAVPYERDEITRVIMDAVDMAAYTSIKSWSVGELRDFLLSATTEKIKGIQNGLTAEMISAVTKLMSNGDLIYAAKKIPVTATCNTTIGLPGTFSVRLQPNHPRDSVEGILASAREGLSYACGDAVIGINPASDNAESVRKILDAVTELYEYYRVPTQNCVLAHITTQMEALRGGAPLDLMFQSLGGSEKTNRDFGISVALLDEAYAMTKELKHSAGENFMYFETGQGTALSSLGHYDSDQLTMEARAYGLSKRYSPFLVNTVVGFIGPEYLYDGKQITRAALEDHFMGKLSGLPMGVDVCYTNHARADRNDMDNIITLLAAAGCNYVMGIPCTDDIMLMYQSTAFHDSAAVRETLNLRPIAAFEKRMEELGILRDGRLGERAGDASVFGQLGNPAEETNARIGVGRVGARMTNATGLKLLADHSVARDAVWNDSDVPQLDGLGFYRIRTLVKDKEEYVRRPDKGKCFSEEALKLLRERVVNSPDIQFIAADGLSPAAIEANIEEMYRLIKEYAEAEGYSFGSPIFVKYGRVASMDKISAALNAKVSLIFIGERPGLGANDSMSCYMGYRCSPDKPEAQWNCVSNIRAKGLTVSEAAEQIQSLIKQYVKYEASGIFLKGLL